MSKCCHEKIKRGPDIPLRYGSYQTRVCENCGMWMTVDHHGDPKPRLTKLFSGYWNPADTLEEATKEIEL